MHIYANCRSCRHGLYLVKGCASMKFDFSGSPMKTRVGWDVASRDVAPAYRRCWISVLPPLGELLALEVAI